MERRDDKTGVNTYYKFCLTVMKSEDGRDYLELVRTHKSDEGIAVDLTVFLDLATQLTRLEANLLQPWLELTMGWPVKITPVQDLRLWKDQHYWGLR